MEKRSEALGIAIEMEREGAEFYRKASEKMSHPFAKRMFLSLVEDERRHESVFREMASQERVRPATLQEMKREGPLKRVSEIFREVSKQIKTQLRANESEIGAIDVAREMEEKAYKFYSSLAKETKEVNEKRVLEKIAEEENEHWRILDDTRLYLTNPVEWHLKEEKPLIDGG